MFVCFVVLQTDAVIDVIPVTTADLSPFLLHCLSLPLLVTLPKPGHCPRLLNVVPSHRGCECDEDCPADHKCCVFDCGAVCVPPAFSTSHNVYLFL